MVCYNFYMELKELIEAYQARWKAVKKIQLEEQSSASPELRWRQLNAAYGMAKGLGLLKPDLSEMEVHQRWATLKTQATNQSPKI
jgi:hypothetical protein